MAKVKSYTCIVCRKREALGSSPWRRYCDDCLRLVDLLRGRASAIVKEAVSLGLLADLRKEKISCVDCRQPAVCYDHRNYSKPLHVDSVCRKCNTRRGPAKINRSLASRWRKAAVLEALRRG